MLVIVIVLLTFDRGPRAAAAVAGHEQVVQGVVIPSKAGADDPVQHAVARSERLQFDPHAEAIAARPEQLEVSFGSVCSTLELVGVEDTLTAADIGEVRIGFEEVAEHRHGSVELSVSAGHVRLYSNVHCWCGDTAGLGSCIATTIGTVKAVECFSDTHELGSIGFVGTALVRVRTPVCTLSFLFQRFLS